MNPSGCRSSVTPCALWRHERLDYQTAWDRQRRRVAEIVAGGASGVFWLLEHDPVYTVGRSGQWGEILDASIPVVETDRGGRVTWHGPGQTVGYVIRDLRPDIHAVRAHVDKLEETVIRTLAGWGVVAEREAKNPGVWVGGEKIAALGVRIRHGVAYHGFAINRDPDLRAYAGIVPCGLPGRGVTSLARLGIEVTRVALEARLLAVFQEVFQVELVDEPWQEN
ncbi:MAG: lipoyl(octanoyl) transferase LipB [Magnetococcales bacterium]|nr:lipoyl(octanoyl) transferase LipB [Magnetococcales bacterium]